MMAFHSVPLATTPRLSPGPLASNIRLTVPADSAPASMLSVTIRDVDLVLYASVSLVRLNCVGLTAWFVVRSKELKVYAVGMKLSHHQ